MCMERENFDSSIEDNDIMPRNLRERIFYEIRNT